MNDLSIVLMVVLAASLYACKQDQDQHDQEISWIESCVRRGEAKNLDDFEICMGDMRWYPDDR